jgi:16S rRNA (adenine1518-N6/adenine1519-N6)-dimethyltransferase
MIRARKRFGQHFLEPAWVDKVIRAIDPKPDDRFVEIGPGAGALTRPLAARANAVVAYEIDRDLAADLRVASIANLTVVEGDFLELENLELLEPGTRTPEPRTRTSEPRTRTPEPRTSEPRISEPRTSEPGTRTPNPEPRTPNPFRVTGNLPYNVASPILFKLAELYAAGSPMADATLMLQREVADRLVAPPGTREYGVLSVLMQHVAAIDLLLKLPAGAFRPPPRVLSSLVRVRFHLPDPPVVDPIVFASVVQAVFTRRRKTLANALLAYTDAPRAARAIAAIGIDGSRRPETLSVAEFARLADAFSI